MSIDLWHHFLLLRPLLVFVLAVPLLVLGLILHRRGESSSLESKAHDASSMASSAMNEGHPEHGPERRVEASSRGWRAGADASDRRAA